MLLITSLCTCLTIILTISSVLSPCNHFLLKYCYLPSLFFHFLCLNFIQVLSQWTELNFLWPLLFFLIVSCSICYKTCSSRLFPTSTITKLQVPRYFFPIGLSWIFLFIINQAHSFWIKEGFYICIMQSILIQKIRFLIDHKVKTLKYISLKSSGIGILQYTESVSLPKSIQSFRWNV